MRIDLALKYLCLVKSRSVAKSLCEKDRVLVGGDPVRSSTSLHEGDRVTLQFPRRTLTVDILQVPDRQLSKSKAQQFYRRVELVRLDGTLDDDFLDDL